MLKDDIAPGSASDVADRFPGGYWHHDVVDHVLLVNLYFPPHAFTDALKSALPSLLPHYPSPKGTSEALVANLIGAQAEDIVVCNGLTEIIYVLLTGMSPSIAVPTPSFNPYEDAAYGGLYRFALSPPLFEMNVNEYAAFVLASPAQAAILINPHNPTSGAVSRKDVLSLASALRDAGKLLLVDESFIEFSPNGPAESVEAATADFENLIVLKSLGKIYGLSGLRLGYCLTGNRKIRNELRKRVPVWNLGVLAEYALSMLPDYRQEAAASWESVRADRDALYQQLASIDGMTAIRPHANFVFARLPDAWPDADKLARRLVEHHGILIRHCKSKTMLEGERYIRIASRSCAENRHLVERLTDVAGL